MLAEVSIAASCSILIYVIFLYIPLVRLQTKLCDLTVSDSSQCFKVRGVWICHLVPRQAWMCLIFTGPMESVLFARLNKKCFKFAVANSFEIDSDQWWIGMLLIRKEADCYELLFFFNMCLPCLFLLFFIYNRHAFTTRLTCLFLMFTTFLLDVPHVFASRQTHLFPYSNQ